MNVKELIGLLQKCKPHEEVVTPHGEITNVLRIKYQNKDYPPEIYLADEESAVDYQGEWPGVEEIK